MAKGPVLGQQANFEGERAVLKVYMSRADKEEIEEAARADALKTSNYISRIVKRHLRELREQKKKSKK